MPLKASDSFALRALGSIFHDFYNGVERIFERIAQELNGDLPAGKNWHIQLLKDMNISIDSLRPAVISKYLFGLLKDFLEFRHRFRNIYGFELEWEKLRILHDKFSLTTKKIHEEIQNFLKFIDALAENI